MPIISEKELKKNIKGLNIFALRTDSLSVKIVLGIFVINSLRLKSFSLIEIFFSLHSYFWRLFCLQKKWFNLLGIFCNPNNNYVFQTDMVTKWYTEGKKSGLYEKRKVYNLKNKKTLIDWLINKKYCINFSAML